MTKLFRSYRAIWCAGWAAFTTLTTPLANAQTEEGSHATAPKAQIRALVEEAIALGVPLYNGGQTAACAAIYRITLRSLQTLTPSAVDSAGIERALRTAAEEDPARAAWTLRYALDDVYTRTEMADHSTNDTPFRIDFSERRFRWVSVNDIVMGGISRGAFTASDEGTGRFTGQLSLRNNGGFSSVRTDVANSALAGYDGVDMRVRGDGRVYKLIAAPRNSRGSWQQDFRATEQWQTIRVPFEDMILSVRGRRPANPPRLRGQDVGMLGVLIADKQTQPFGLEIDWVQGYRDETATIR